MSEYRNTEVKKYFAGFIVAGIIIMIFGIAAALPEFRYYRNLENESVAALIEVVLEEYPQVLP